MNDQKCSAMHEMFRTDHDRQRDELLLQLRSEQRPMWFKPRRWIAAVSGLAAMLGIVAIAWLALSPGKTEITWAQVVKQVQKTQTASYQIITDDYEHGSHFRRSLLIWFRAPDQHRWEWGGSPATTTTSTHSAVSRFHLTNPTLYPGCTFMVGMDTEPGDEATVVQDLCIGPPVDQNTGRDDESFFARLRSLDGAQVVRKGEEILDGQNVIRFEEPASAYDPTFVRGVMAIWVNDATSLPVRLSSDDIRRSADPDTIGSFELKNLQFDRPLDDQLFEFPDLDRKKVSQCSTIILPRAMSLRDVSLEITAPDGHVLATSGDLEESVLDFGHTHVPIRLVSAAARKRMEGYCQLHQKLRVQLDGQDTQPMEIFGKLRYVKLVPPVPPYDMPATRP
jgi:hypothetical protein